MLLESLKIIALPEEKQWEECKHDIKRLCEKDPLYKNYVDLSPENYYHFNAVTYNDKIISFGGIEYSPNKWGSEIARVLTRFWIHPDYRSKNLTKWSNNEIRYSPLILRAQIDFLKQQSKIKVAMITREGKYLRSFKEIVRLAKTVCDDFEIIPGVFNVCERMPTVPHSCRQMIALAQLSDIEKKIVFHNCQINGYLKEI
jgi:hypothetical protein